MIDLAAASKLADHFVSGAAVAVVASTAVRALPDPEPMGGRFYLWFYRFTQGLLANWDKVKEKP